MGLEVPNHRASSAVTPRDLILFFDPPATPSPTRSKESTNLDAVTNPYCRLTCGGRAGGSRFGHRLTRTWLDYAPVAPLDGCPREAGIDPMVARIAATGGGDRRDAVPCVALLG